VRNAPQVVGNEQIDQVVDVRQSGADQPIDGHRPIPPLLAERVAGRSDVRRIGIEAMHQVTGASLQGGGPPGIAAAQVDDQPALHAAGGQDLSRLAGLVHRGYGQRQSADEQHGK